MGDQSDYERGKISGICASLNAAGMKRKSEELQVRAFKLGILVGMFVAVFSIFVTALIVSLWR